MQINYLTTHTQPHILQVFKDGFGNYQSYLVQHQVLSLPP